MPETLWYSLAEAAKATRIPRGRLDHACRVGRLQYRRSETGARLLPQNVIEKLRKQGLAAFPRPYDPVAVAAPEEAKPKQADGPSAAERIGLLAEPSAEIVKAKERAEAAKLKVEEQKASLELARISAERAALYKQMAAERQAEEEQRRLELEAEAEQQREEAEERYRVAQGQRDFQRRKDWLANQLRLALSEASSEVGIFGVVPFESRPEAKEQIGRELVQATADLGPDSSAVSCEKARKQAIDHALAPYRQKRASDQLHQVIESALSTIPFYLDRLYEDGYINLREEDRAFVARRIRPRVKAAVERQARARSGGLTEAEAVELVHGVVDRELRLD